ncbi:MAG: dTMP kinase [Nanoarchaeota archaeon]|nr:dTMP kinase [Nanoarchaeota archaeon]
MEKTFFIAFDGMDGCGKDTQLQRLVEIVREDDGYPFGNKYSNIWITREPTKITQSGIKISELIRKREVSGKEASELFVKDRIEHTVMIKEILKHSHVFTSRYDFSTLSFQMTQGLDFDYLYDLHKYGEENGAIIPDLTIIFDLPTNVAFERMKGRNSVEECFERKDFQEKLREKLFEAVEMVKKKDGRKIIIVNSNQSRDEVTKEMLEKISRAIKNLK